MSKLEEEKFHVEPLGVVGMRASLNNFTLTVATALVLSASGCATTSLIDATYVPSPTATPLTESEGSASLKNDDVSQFATSNPSPNIRQYPAIRPNGDEATEGDLIIRLLSFLRVAEPVESGYSRDLFKHWIDADKDSCDTRREVLLEEAVDLPSVLNQCKLEGGAWYSQYDGLNYEDSSELDIDHFIPLKEAWESGADQWDSQRREEFANDLGYAGSLIAVSASTNRSKSDRDPAQWLPPNQSYHCTYLVTWLEVKVRWNLSVDELEARAISRESTKCGSAP